MSIYLVFLMVSSKILTDFERAGQSDPFTAVFWVMRKFFHLRLGLIKERAMKKGCRGPVGEAVSVGG